VKTANTVQALPSFWSTFLHQIFRNWETVHSIKIYNNSSIDNAPNYLYRDTRHREWLHSIIMHTNNPIGIYHA